MRLGLCSAVAPGAGLEELLMAVRRRGLSGLELRAGDAHGVAPEDLAGAATAAGRARREGVEIGGYRVTSPPKDDRLVTLAKLLEAPLLLDASWESQVRLRWGAWAAAEGAAVAFVVRGPEPMVEARRAVEAGLDLAWDAEPATAPPGTIARVLVAEFGIRLTHVRLHGGGPEAQLQEGLGIGEMTGYLALAGYEGTFVLTPTSERHRAAWQAWLGRGGGWGCGSRTAEPRLVDMSRLATRTGGNDGHCSTRRP
ncbi:MAG: hypothetical protein IT347_13980 [Candidatus Eisenbacteria bacterium]|nr:hypothetical protein [Candidatus Eisenbacteria bacterium]